MKTRISGSYLCECWTGFSENKTSSGCDDLDECTADLLTGIATHNCHRLADRPDLVTAYCKNTIGTYDCECNDGFSGDGFICNDKDECETGNNNCDTNSECINRIGDFECQCFPGFTSDDITTGKCYDIDECLTGIHYCGPGAECNNLQGSFECNCLIGYSGDDDDQCYDIDECAVSETRLNTCSPHSKCNNNDGSYTCTCSSGFTGDAIGPKGCRDIDECNDNIAECDDYAECVNNEGSYRKVCTLECNISPIIILCEMCKAI